MCKRAVQRLEEYEARIIDLAGRRSNALHHNNIDQVGDSYLFVVFLYFDFLPVEAQRTKYSWFEL